MRTNNRANAAKTITPILLGFFVAAGLFAQNSNDDIRQTVARVSYLNGAVSYARGDDPDNWQPADVNVPLTLGDRIYTGRGGRAELQIHGGGFVRLSAEADLTALNLTDDTKQLSLQGGDAALQIRRLGADEVFEIDTPNAAITLERAGDYRVSVDADGNSRVGVSSGSAIVSSGGGQVTLRSGDEMDIEGIDAPRYGVVALAAPDAFDQWVRDREARIGRSRSQTYVSQDIVGVADLDDSGRWESIPQYGRVWTPAITEAGWAPYRDGHWVWQDPWGWTWVSSEAWGWAPYHYGRWITSSSRWYWVPDAPRAPSVRYAPALVAFVGGGPGLSGGAGGFVGWFPLAPRDPLVPWWGRRGRENVANVTYVNRTSITVVNQNTFVSGGLVARNVVTDRTVMRDVVAAPVLRGPLPFTPTRESLHVAVRAGLPAPPRPPAIVAERAVVARVAPPPAPPSFAAKVDIIRQNRGAPVDAAASARIVQQGGEASRPAAAIRSVAPQQGQVTLAPRNAGDSGRATVHPVPVSPDRGRPMVSTERATTGGNPGGAPPRAEVARPPEQIRGAQAPATGAAPQAPARVERQQPFVAPTPSSSGARPANQDWRSRPSATDQSHEGAPQPPSQGNPQAERARIAPTSPPAAQGNPQGNPRVERPVQVERPPQVRTRPTPQPPPGDNQAPGKDRAQVAPQENPRGDRQPGGQPPPPPPKAQGAPAEHPAPPAEAHGQEQQKREEVQKPKEKSKDDQKKNDQKKKDDDKKKDEKPQ